MDSSMCIPTGHQQERPRVGFLGQGLHTPKPDEDDPAIMSMATLAVGE
jgi:hypothetical protein